MKMIQAAAICLLLTLLSTHAALAMPVTTDERAGRRTAPYRSCGRTGLAVTVVVGE